MPDKSGLDVGKGCFVELVLVGLCVPDKYGLDFGKGCFFHFVLFGLCLFAELRARQAKQDNKQKLDSWR